MKYADKQSNDIVYAPFEERFLEENRYFQGCPSIAVTPAGRIYLSWVGGGMREPHIENYGVLSYSDDKGKTWSDPMLIGSEYRRAGENVFNKAPGVGLVIQKGKYNGRILFPLYRGNSEVQHVACLYSDDCGRSWKMSQDVPNGNEKCATEAQLVELPDGSLRMYARSRNDCILYADSFDGGDTFTPLRPDASLLYCRDCMVSAVALPYRVDGCDAIAISYPEGEKPGGTRKSGIIKIGLLQKGEDGYQTEWKYSKSVDPSYWYSCLATKGDKLAVLYERDQSHHFCELVYREFSLSDFEKILG